MREPGWLIRLEDMLVCALRISEYSSSLSKVQFIANRQAIDAVLHNLIIIGEAANRIPDDVKFRLTDVEWQKIRGMRNRLVHDYFSADLDVVWKTATEDVPDLVRVLPALIAAEEERQKPVDKSN
jgi:uncharacterized protein with HEPN domain